MLLEHLPKHKSSAIEYFEKNLLFELQEEVHKLRGSAAYCGVMPLLDACKVLEESLVNGYDKPAIMTQFAELIRQIDELMGIETPGESL